MSDPHTGDIVHYVNERGDHIEAEIIDVHANNCCCLKLCPRQTDPPPTVVNEVHYCKEFTRLTWHLPENQA